MLTSKKQSEVFTNFLQSQSYVCSRKIGSKPFHVTVPIKATMSIHWKNHQQMDIFLFFYLALCAHETCFMTRPWKRMVCMYFCQQQASQHNTVVAGKSLYFRWKRKKRVFWSGACFRTAIWDSWTNLFTPGAGFKFIKQ